MAEDISVKILTQTSENIQRLFDLTTRIDERVKSIQGKQDELDDRLDKVIHRHTEIMQKIAVLESQNGGAAIAGIAQEVTEVKKEVIAIDKRLSAVEGVSGNQQERWKNITGFVIQLVWIIIAAWLLMKLNLNPPPVP